MGCLFRKEVHNGKKVDSSFSVVQNLTSSLILQEQLFETKAKKVRKANMDVDSILNEIPKPSIKNTLPFQIPCGIYAMITGTPSAIKESINLVADMRKKELEKKQRYV